MKKEKEKLKASEMYYNTAELTKLKYAKVIYTGLDGEYHEITTEVKFAGDVLISLHFKYKQDFNINYPQDVIIKLITSDAMYLAKAVLQEIKKTDNMVHFSVLPPTKMVRQQKRKYCRANINCNCVLVVTDEKGENSVYLAKSVNLSASGILLHELETIDSDNSVKREMSKYDVYHILIFMESGVVIKLFARFVRSEIVNGSDRYAFHFLNTNAKDVDMICKLVTNEQVKQLKLQQKYKESNVKWQSV